MLLLICKSVHLVCPCPSGEQLHISNEFGKARKVILFKICSFIAFTLSVSHPVHGPDSQESQLLLSKSWAGFLNLATLQQGSARKTKPIRENVKCL